MVQGVLQKIKGLASYRYRYARTTFTFHFSTITLSNAFLSINQREIKSESGFSLAMASQPFYHNAFCCSTHLGDLSPPVEGS